MLRSSGSISLGKLGELAAAAALRHRGYAITATNYRTRFGEIDIVCQRDDTLAFVEVKARRSARRGSAAESVPLWKRRRIAAMALDYLAYTGQTHKRYRFDVVAIDAAGTDHQTIRIIEDAFRPGQWQ